MCFVKINFETKSDTAHIRSETVKKFGQLTLMCEHLEPSHSAISGEKVQK